MTMNKTASYTLGSDFSAFAVGLRAALRQAPKVILVGEMRDRETMEIAMTAAETGHLVLSTLHTIDAGQTINRILSMFQQEEQPQIRNRLVDTIRWIVSQRLLAEGRRRPGGGDKPVTETDPGLMAALEALIEPATRGDPESPLRWTCKSTRRLAEELTRQNHPVGARTVAKLLRDAEYSLQANRKTREGASHPDRNAQFEYINASVRRFLKRDQPAVSVDAKKKENVGDFKNGGREWFPEGRARRGARLRLPDQVVGQGGSRTACTICCGTRVGQRRHRSRHGAVCREQHPSMVEGNGATALPACPRTADHRGWRR